MRMRGSVLVFISICIFILKPIYILLSTRYGRGATLLQTLVATITPPKKFKTEILYFTPQKINNIVILPYIIFIQ